MAAAGLLRKALTLQIVRSITFTLAKQNPFQSTTRAFHLSAIKQKKYFSDKHEWVDVDEKNKTAIVGVTHYAQDKLGEIVFVQLPEIGQALEAHGEAGVLESVKAASDVYSPISGKVTAVNTTVVDNPKLINDSPYKDGWMFKCTVGDTKDLKGLMDEAGYEEYVKTCD